MKPDTYYIVHDGELKVVNSMRITEDDEIVAEFLDCDEANQFALMANEYERKVFPIREQSFIRELTFFGTVPIKNIN